ncbi:MAG: ribbon-helix-helix protein, CopG family [Wenzhouxiangella sp.]
MPTTTIKSTYSLDPSTVRDLERLARRFGTSKSEVLRRAVQSLAGQEAEPETNGIQALGALQTSLGLSEQGARDWTDRIQKERAAMGREPADG